MAEELTGQDIALYLNGECKAKRSYSDQWTTNFITTALLIDYKLRVVKIKPILKLFKDITPREKAKYCEWVDKPSDPIRRYADTTKYLLSIRVDVFGWIEAGLAIDKTTLK